MLFAAWVGLMSKTLALYLCPRVGQGAHLLSHLQASMTSLQNALGHLYPLDRLSEVGAGTSLEVVDMTGEWASRIASQVVVDSKEY